MFNSSHYIQRFLPNVSSPFSCNLEVVIPKMPLRNNNIVVLLFSALFRLQFLQATPSSPESIVHYTKPVLTSQIATIYVLYSRVAASSCNRFPNCHCVILPLLLRFAWCSRKEMLHSYSFKNKKQTFILIQVPVNLCSFKQFGLRAGHWLDWNGFLLSPWYSELVIFITQTGALSSKAQCWTIYMIYKLHGRGEGKTLFKQIQGL